MLIGYIRVSTKEQHIERQQKMMEEQGADKIYIDECSGSTADRPQLKEMMEFVRKGDTIVVESISRMARCTKDLLNLVEQLETKGVIFKSLKENIDTTTSFGKYMLAIMGAMSELEKSWLLTRQREGIEIAKEKGIYKGRQRIEIPHFEVIYKEWKNSKGTNDENRLSKRKACEILQISKSTFDRRAKEYEAIHLRDN